MRRDVAVPAVEAQSDKDRIHVRYGGQHKDPVSFQEIQPFLKKRRRIIHMLQNSGRVENIETSFGLSALLFVLINPLPQQRVVLESALGAELVTVSVITESEGVFDRPAVSRADVEKTSGGFLPQNALQNKFSRPG